MTENPKKRFRKAADQIDLNLTGLVGSLGDALHDAVTKFGQVANNDQSFDTVSGPMRAKAGIRVRMGGLNMGAAPEPRPVNPGRKPERPTAPKPKSARPLVFDLLEDLGGWIVTAEMPGVSVSDVILSIDGDELVVDTVGDRTYHGRIELLVVCRIDEITKVLNNGILTLHLPGKAAE